MNWLSGGNYFDKKRKKTLNSGKTVGFKSLKKPLEKADHQTGKTNRKRDKARKALPPGKRMSKTGKIYWEYRKNRTDLGGSI